MVNRLPDPTFAQLHNVGTPPIRPMQLAADQDSTDRWVGTITPDPGDLNWSCDEVTWTFLSPP